MITFFPGHLCSEPDTPASERRPPGQNDSSVHYWRSHQVGTYIVFVFHYYCHFCRNYRCGNLNSVVFNRDTTQVGPRFQNKYLNHCFLGSTVDCPQPAWHGWGEDCQRDRRIFQVFIVFLNVRYKPRQFNSIVKGPTDLQEEQEDGSKSDWTSPEQPRWICFLACQLFSSTFSVIWCAGYSQTVIPVLSNMPYIPLLSSCMPANLKWW